MRGEIEPMPGEIEMNIEKLRKIQKFLFGWRGHLVTIFDQITFFRYSTTWTTLFRYLNIKKIVNTLEKIRKTQISFLGGGDIW